MNRKTLAFCLALAAAPAFAVTGDETPTAPGARRGPPMEMLTEVLQLRPDQVAQVEAILTEQREAHRQDRQRNRDQRQAMHQQTVEKLSTVLDAEQLARFDGFAQGMQMRKGMGMRQNCGGRGGPANR